MWAVNAPSSAKNQLKQISIPGMRSWFEFLVRVVQETVQTLLADAVVIVCPQKSEDKSLMIKTT